MQCIQLGTLIPIFEKEILYLDFEPLKLTLLPTLKIHKNQFLNPKP